ncbi:hypothetical protein LWI29_011836 [Acer saccharum]|uniref:DUF1985 domain-containing protein n=1 Tax=Acer saccharum TaxID=4024 RepID=A0AA39S8G2_ACESA|nr:hypothetical protein LWI29_011836 [Acer saccharum]
MNLKLSLKTPEASWYEGTITRHNHIEILDVIDDALSLADDAGVQKQRFMESCFGHFLRMHRQMQFSGAIVHHLLLRELHHDGPNDEMRFMLGNTSVRFSRVEFCLITGLKFGVVPDTTGYLAVENGIHQRYFGGRDVVKIEELRAKVRLGQWTEQFDVVKLCMLSMLHVFLTGVDERGDVPIWQLRFVENLDAFDVYPWGSYVYSYSIYGFMNALYDRKMRFEHRQQVKGKEKHPKEKYNIYGFAYSLLIFALEVIPDLATNFAQRTNNDPFPRILKWEFTKRPRPDKIIKIIKDKMFTEEKLNPTDQELGKWYYKGIQDVEDLYPNHAALENMPKMSSVEDDGDRVERLDIPTPSHTRSTSGTTTKGRRKKIKAGRRHVRPSHAGSRVPNLLITSMSQPVEDTGRLRHVVQDIPRVIGGPTEPQSSVREGVSGVRSCQLDAIMQSMQQLREDFHDFESRIHDRMEIYLGELRESERRREEQHAEVMCILRTFKGPSTYMHKDNCFPSPPADIQSMPQDPPPPPRDPADPPQNLANPPSLPQDPPPPRHVCEPISTSQVILPSPKDTSTPSSQPTTSMDPSRPVRLRKRGRPLTTS